MWEGEAACIAGRAAWDGLGWAGPGGALSLRKKKENGGEGVGVGILFLRGTADVMYEAGTCIQGDTKAPAESLWHPRRCNPEVRPGNGEPSWELTL